MIWQEQITTMKIIRQDSPDFWCRPRNGTKFKAYPMKSIKQLFSGRAGYAQIETACTELADDMSRQKWIPPGEDMKATYGIFGFTSAKNAVNDLHEYAQTIIDILNTPNCDVQTKREMLNEIKLTVETTVETLKKS